jgi:hypothetical protein
LNKQFSSLLVLLIFASLGIACAQGVERVNVHRLQCCEAVTRPSDISTYKGTLYVLDDFTIRVLAYSDDGSLKYTFGGIGNGRGELFHPQKIAISDDLVAVLDRLNHRIGLFSHTGKHVGEMALPHGDATLALAINNKDHLFLNDPRSGTLVSEYDVHGALVRKFGEMTSMPGLFGEAGRKYTSEALRMSANRVWLATDQDDNVYALFVLAPVIRKYSSQGVLLYERKLGTSIAQELESIFLNYKPQVGGFLSSNLDGEQVPIIMRGIVFDDQSGNLEILAAMDPDRQGMQLEVGRDGAIKKVTILDGLQNGAFFKIAASKQTLYLVPMFTTGIFVTTLGSQSVQYKEKIP